MTVTLFAAPGSCSFASHVALEYAGASFEVELVDFGGDAQRKADYLAINPKGRVPTLRTPQGNLTETPAILVYIAQCFPEAKLAPLDDPWAFARMQSFNAYLCATVHVAHAHKYRGYRWASEQSSFDDMRVNVPRTMGECFALIEQEMLGDPWVLGAEFSVADIYLLTVARWLESDEVDLEPLPRVIEHRERMLALPAVQKVIERESRL